MQTVGAVAPAYRSGAIRRSAGDVTSDPRSMVGPVSDGDIIQRLRMKAAAEALASGRHKIDLACEHCECTSVYLDPHLYSDGALTCAACGRYTPYARAKEIRLERIRKFIRAGVDVDLTKKGRSTMNQRGGG